MKLHRKETYLKNVIRNCFLSWTWRLRIYTSKEGKYLKQKKYLWGKVVESYSNKGEGMWLILEGKDGKFSWWHKIHWNGWHKIQNVLRYSWFSLCELVIYVLWKWHKHWSIDYWALLLLKGNTRLSSYKLLVTFSSADQ